MLEDVDTVAVTAGASAPEHLVEELISHLEGQGLYGTWKKRRSRKRMCASHLPSDLEKLYTPLIYRTSKLSEFAQTMKHSLQTSDSLSSAVSGAIQQGRSLAFEAASAEGFWWARLDCRHHAGVGLHH